MKITKLALSAAIAAACLGGSAFAQAPANTNDFGYYASAPATAPVTTGANVGVDYASVVPAASSCSDAPLTCDAGCGDSFCDSGCDSACDSGCGVFGGCGDEPWTLFQNDVAGFTIGGWTSLGYHTANNSLFNSADNVNLHQAWLFAEKIADGSDGLGFGGRVDYIYGVDGPDTQAFGINNNSWDNSWDNGGNYGHAMPQLYGEVAYGDLSVKAGHFYTLIGYEVVAATGNFFYSHSYTMYNSEPFTHTGALATYAGDNATLFGGYVMGWDSGFEDNGDAFLGGYSVDLTDSVNLTSQYVMGRFGEAGNSEAGFMTSQILTSQLSDSVTHVLWVDWLDSDGTGRAVQRETFDINNYLLVGLTDCVTWGNRFEWYNIDSGVYGVTAGKSDVYAYTTGLNIGLGSNLLFRPEIRWDFDKDSVTGLEKGSRQTTVASDMVFTF